MSKVQQESKLLAEFLRRTKSFNFLDENFPAQNNFILDTSRFKAGQCSRRSGKSYGAGLYLFKEMLENPGCTVLYIALTRESAKKIMYKDVLKRINKKYNLGASFNEITLTVTMPNGSIGYLAGADAKPDEMQKFLGQAYRLVVIDESASFKQDLREMVYEILKPAMADLRGTICMIGTPGKVPRGLFYDITTGEEKGWSVHKWTAKDNPHMKDKIAEEMGDLVKSNPFVVETPFYQRMYLNQWVRDINNLVYKFNEDRNLIDIIPQSLLPYIYILGVDLGFNDDSAFTVLCFNEHDPTLYIKQTHKRPGMDITDVANEIKRLMTLHTFQSIEIDGANKQAVEEIRRRHGLPLNTADKREKAEFIDIFNSELIRGEIKLVRNQCDTVIEEWQELIWDIKNVKRVEHSGCANHNADSTLYAWRKAYAYRSQRPEPKKAPTSDEYMKEWLKKESEKHMNQKEEPWYNR